MAKSLQVSDDLAQEVSRIAEDLGETDEQFVERALVARLKAFRGNPFFARRRKSFDRDAVLEWWLSRKGGEPPPPEDRIPDDDARPE